MIANTANMENAAQRPNVTFAAFSFVIASFSFLIALNPMGNFPFQLILLL